MDILQYRENKKINILVVEDDNILGRIYADIFSKEGYKVYLAKSGKSALNKFSENSISIAVIDLMLPDLSGVSVLEHIKESKKNVKVIILTNVSNSSILQECVRLGISSYIIKSNYTPDQILTELERVKNTDDLIVLD